MHNTKNFGRFLTVRHFLTACLAVGITTLAFGATQFLPSGEADEPSQPRPVPVSVVPAKKLTSYEVSRSYTGEIKAARHSELAFELSGKVIEITVDIGDEVKLGQPLAKLDQRHLLAERAAQRAELQQAEAVYAELIAGPRVETIAAVAAELNDLDAQLKRATNDHRRREVLVNSGAVTYEDFEESLYEMRALVARRDVVVQRLKELRAGTRKERIAAQEAQVLRLKAQLSDLDHDLEDTILRAPYNGRVSVRHIDEGAVVTSSTMVLEITENEKLEFWVGLPTSAAMHINEGHTYPLSSDGYEILVNLKSRAPALSRTTHTRTLLFTIPESDSTAAVDGQIARIHLPQVIEEPGFWVPTAALVPQSRGLWATYVVVAGEDSEKIASSRDVEILATEGDLSFVRGTLSEGELVIFEGVHRVVQGQLVEPIAQN